MSTDNSFTILDLESIYRKVKYYFVYGFPLDDNILIRKLGWYSPDKIPKFKKNRLQSPTEQEFAKMEKFISVINSHDFYVKADKELQGSFGKRHYIEKKPYEIGQELWQNYLYTLYDRGIDYEYGQVIAAERKKLRSMKYLCNKLINSNRGCLRTLAWEVSEITEQKDHDAEKGNREAYEEGSLEAAYNEMETLSVLEKDSQGWLRVYKKSEVDDLCKSISSQTQIISAISFLDKFVPLSVLGYLLRQRIMKENRKLEPLPIIIRGLSPFIGLRYENIYRSVKAASEKVSIKIGDKKIYEPEIWVSGQSFIAKNEDIYISESKKRQLKTEDEGGIYQIEVYFFWNSDTEYIEKRICECWIPIKTFYKKEIKLDYESPYYKFEKRKWNVKKATYHIPKSDWPEFARWCDSFGDFAVVLNDKVEIKTEIKNEIMKLPDKTLIELDKKSLGRKVIKDWALLSRYNSMAADKQIKTYPTKAEWGWLAFVLEKFPNFTKIFLTDDVYEKLKQKVENLVDGDNIFFEDGRGGESRFDGQIYDIESADQAEKYRRILDDIRNKRCCRSSSDKTGIHYSIPYVLDMNYNAYTRKAVNEPFKIMVYDMEEKRSCAVNYGDFYTTNQGQRIIQGDLFSLSERYYYICAYSVRLEWDDSKREGKKSVASQFKREYEKFQKSIRKMDISIRSQMENVFLKSFQFIYHYLSEDEAGLSKNEAERETNGVPLFQNKEIIYKTLILKKMVKHIECLADEGFSRGMLRITEEDIKDFIVGSGRFDIRKNREEKAEVDKFREEYFLKDDAQKTGQILTKNEAVFCNELKKCIAKFRLKPGCFTEENLDILYNYFREFRCFGQYKKEESERDEVLFSVEYPRFEFRRVHQILLALTSMIDFDTVWPEETKNVLQKRLEGKVKNRQELEKILSGAERDGEAYTGEER